MNSQFGYENPFFSMMNKIVDCFYASFLWIVFSLPIVTAGAASTAFYYTIHKCVRGSRGYVWQSFWSAFQSNGKQMTKIWLLMLGIFAFLFTDYRIMKSQWDTVSRLGFCVTYSLPCCCFGRIGACICLLTRPGLKTGSRIR